MELKAQICLLSALAPNRRGVNHVGYNGATIEFNFNRFSFVGATTHPNKLQDAFLNRFDRVDLEPYSKNDLGEILTRYLEDISVDEETVLDIVSTVRYSPRTLVMLADKITKNCNLHKLIKLTKKNWEELKYIFNINPLGLTETEIKYLRFLSEYGTQRLTRIAAKLNLDRTTIQGDTEKFLSSEGLVEIDTKRTITCKGKKILKLL